MRLRVPAAMMEEAERPTVAAAILAFGLISSLVNDDFSFPLQLLTGNLGDELKLASDVENGDWMRRLALPMLIPLTIFLITRPQTRRPELVLPLGLIGIVYLGWCFSSLLWSDDVPLTLRRLSSLLLCVAGMVGLSTFDLRSIQRLMATIILFKFAVGLVNELSLGTFHPLLAEYRFSGSLHPNAQATQMAQLALTGLCWSLHPTLRWRWTGSAVYVLGLAVVVLTQSRNSLICLLAVSFFLAILWSWCRGGSVLLVIASMLGVVGGAMMFAQSLSPDTSPVDGILMALEKPRDEGDIESLTGRIDVWQSCIEIGMQRPILGFGYEAFWTPDRIMMVSRAVQWAINQAHSVYVENFVTLGVIGLALWCLLSLASLAVSIKRYAAGQSSDYSWVAGQIAFGIMHGFNESYTFLPLTIGFIVMTLMVHLALHREVHQLRTGTGLEGNLAARPVRRRVVSE